MLTIHITQNVFGGHVVLPRVICDHCQKKFEIDRPGQCVYPAFAGGQPFHIHDDCLPGFIAENLGDWASMTMPALLLNTLTNTSEKAARCRKALHRLFPDDVLLSNENNRPSVLHELGLE